MAAFPSWRTGRTIYRQLSSYSLTGLLTCLWLRLRGKSILVTGSCRGCGSCCRRINLEGPQGWLRSEEVFTRLLRDNPEYRRFEVTGGDEQGFLLFSCSWLTAAGSCRQHDHRLPLCRRFPEKSLIFAGGGLPAGCGYRFVVTEPFAKVLARAERGRR